MTHAADLELPVWQDAFRADLHEMWRPATSLELHEVENIVAILTRQRLLDRLEEKALMAALSGPSSEEAPGKPLPSLDSLTRYRRRLAKELADAGAKLKGLIGHRERAEAQAARDAEASLADEPVAGQGKDEAASAASLARARAAWRESGTDEQFFSDDFAATVLDPAQRRRGTAALRHA